MIGEFGCRDPGVSVQAIVERGHALAVSLKQWPLAQSQVEYQALSPTYRPLTVGRAQLSRPHPPRVDLRLAGA